MFKGSSGKDWEWRVEELQEIFSSLLAAAKTQSIVVFLDALDEAGSETAPKIVTYLRQLYKKFGPERPTRIGFSCRHFPAIALKDGFEVRMEDSNQDDIVSYISKRLSEELDIGEDTDMELQNIISLQNHLVLRASGVFMWVALVIPLILPQYNNGEPWDAIYRTVDEVPQDLEEVYRHILTEVVHPLWRADTLYLMQWILFAHRPLSATELRFALASDDSVITPNQSSCAESNGFIESDTRILKWVTSRTGGLVEIKHHIKDGVIQGTIVQFIHQSVSDFLLKDHFRCLELDTSTNIAGSGHHRLARSCLNYLKLRCVRLGVKATLHNRDITSFYWHEVRGKVSKILPFWDYASHYWHVHSKRAELSGISQVDLPNRRNRFDWPSDEVLATWICSCHPLARRYKRRNIRSRNHGFGTSGSGRTNRRSNLYRRDI